MLEKTVFITSHNIYHVLNELATYITVNYLVYLISKKQLPCISFSLYISLKVPSTLLLGKYHWVTKINHGNSRNYVLVQNDKHLKLFQQCINIYIYIYYSFILNNLEEPYYRNQEVNLSPKWEDVIWLLDPTKTSIMPTHFKVLAILHCIYMLFAFP